MTILFKNRHQFYLQAKVDLIEGKLSVTDPAATVRICALVAQSEMGDATGMPCQTESYLLSFFPHVTVKDLESFQASRDEWIAKILQQHQTLKVSALLKLSFGTITNIIVINLEYVFHFG